MIHIRPLVFTFVLTAALGITGPAAIAGGPARELAASQGAVVLEQCRVSARMVQMGDKVLHHVASVMKGVTREVDIVSRYGGEEFAVILPNTGEEGAISCAENIRGTVERTGLGVEGGELKVTLSVGVACLDADVRDEDDLLRRADAALWRAKALGRNQVRLWRAEEEAVPGQG